MARRFNPAPGWPAPPAGWTPPPGWKPDPAWPPAPPGWQFWVEDDTPAAATGPAPTGPVPTQPADGGPAAGEAPPPGGGPAGSRPGWDAPEGAGPGFTAWVRDHKLLSGAAVLLLVVLLGWWAVQGSGDQDPVAGDRGGNGVGWPPGQEEEPLPTPSADKVTELTAAINAALSAPLPTAPQTPGGSATGTPGATPGTSAPIETGTGSAAPTPTEPTPGGPGVGVEALGRESTPIFVRWSIDPALTGDALKDSARVDALKILMAVKAAADYGYSRVVLIGSHAGADGASQQQVVEATYAKSTLDRTDLNRLQWRRVFDVGDDVTLAPALRYP
jgi:hypothetical protein